MKRYSLQNISAMNSKTFFTDWKAEFIERIKKESKSKKQTFGYVDAFQKSINTRTDFDNCMIAYDRFIRSNPLQNNDYYKYVKSYSKGAELNLKYFRHNPEKLQGYYKKCDEKKYNPFNKAQYEDYVLFMMLKLKGLYKIEFDEIFNVKMDGSREYNPLTNIPSVIRGELPMDVQEFDVCRAFSTFIDNELNIERQEDVYSLIDKRVFLTKLNLHSGSNTTIEKLRNQLFCVFGDRVNEVITEARFNKSGQMFDDLTVYEKQSILDFVTVNNLVNYVRLHDGVFVLSDAVCEVMEVNNVKFSIKECIKPEIINEVVSFYSADEDGANVSTNEKMYFNFLVQEGFKRITEVENDKITILKDTNNVVIPFNHRTDAVSFFKENINDFYTDEIEIRIAKDNNSIIQNSYQLLKPIPLKYHRDKRDTFGIAFKNGFMEYDKKLDEVKHFSYTDVDGFFAPHETQERDFIYNEDTGPSVFQLFLTMASTGKNTLIEKLTDAENETFEKFCIMFGYLIHQYKDESFNPAIVLSDAGANDRTRNGGRGKSLITKAVEQVRNVMLKGGAEFDPTYLFNYADLTKAHDVFIIDDVPAAFNYNALYTQISGGINCQRKGKPAQLIPFKESPKFVITTNWSYRVDESSTSTERRFFEFQLTDFFNIENTPKKVFNQTLFDDWDAGEWNRFYNFSFGCVVLFLDKGLQRIIYNKTEDNFRASFNDDAKLEEMERIIDELLIYKNEFSVSDFLNHYNKIDNNLRFEKYFHSRNTKSLIDIFIKHHQKPLKYVLMTKKWQNLDC
jgi:hypothetical protein